MKAVLKHVGEAPKVFEIEDKLEAFQQIVEGYIEAVGLPNGVMMICNEEGKLEGLKANFALGSDVIVGNVCFISTKGDEFDSLTPLQTEYVLNLFK